MKWIPITEQRPPEDKWVLMWFECYKCRHGMGHSVADEGYSNAIHHRAFVGKMYRNWIQTGERSKYDWSPQKPTHWAEIPGGLPPLEDIKCCSDLA